MAKYAVTREKYTRYGDGGIITTTLQAQDDVEALIKIDDHCGYGWCDSEGRELGDESFELPTFQQVMEHITSNNGDGADYIFKIENLDTGKVLFKSDDYYLEEEEDW